jgi:hypothetical protein
MARARARNKFWCLGYSMAIFRVREGYSYGLIRGRVRAQDKARVGLGLVLGLVLVLVLGYGYGYG